MKRSKLEYLLRHLPREQENELVREIDPKGEYMFGPLICKFLATPNTRNPDILCFVPGWRYPENIEECKEKYRAQYRKINDLCIKNGIKPFFPKPDNIKQSEAIRRDLVAQVPESALNAFFGVNSFYDFVPPKYDPNPS